MPSTKKIEEYSKEDLRAALERAAAIVQNMWFCCDCQHKGACIESDEACKQNIILWLLGEGKGQ